MIDIITKEILSSGRLGPEHIYIKYKIPMKNYLLVVTI